MKNKKSLLIVLGLAVVVLAAAGVWLCGLNCKAPETTTLEEKSPPDSSKIVAPDGKKNTVKEDEESLKKLRGLGYMQ